MQLNLNNIYIYRTTKHSVNRITKRRSFSPRTLHLQFPRHASSRSALKMGYVQLLILLNEFCKHVTWNAQSFIQRKSNYNNDHIKNHVLKAIWQNNNEIFPLGMWHDSYLQFSGSGSIFFICQKNEFDIIIFQFYSKINTSNENWRNNRYRAFFHTTPIQSVMAESLSV